VDFDIIHKQLIRYWRKMEAKWNSKPAIFKDFKKAYDTIKREV
jgi:hypothetical protein